MTTVAIDVNGEIAADSRAANDNGFYTDTQVKLLKVNGSILGCAGVCSEGLLFKRWFTDQTKDKPALTNNFEALVVNKDGIFYYDENLIPERIKPPYAIGSGSVFAMAAMYSGKTAIEAVRIAIKLDIHSGGKVQSIKVK